MSPCRYTIRPKADQDLEDQAIHYASKASLEIGHRFLVAAHNSFALLATQPHMGWPVKLRHPALASLRVFRVKGFEKIIILYRPVTEGAEIIRVLHGSRNIQAMLRRQGLA